MDFFTLGILPVSWSYSAEIQPLNVRNKSMAVGVFSHWMSNFVVVMVTPIALNSIQGNYFWVSHERKNAMSENNADDVLLHRRSGRSSAPPSCRLHTFSVSRQLAARWSKSTRYVLYPQARLATNTDNCNRCFSTSHVFLWDCRRTLRESFASPLRKKRRGSGPLRSWMRRT